MLYEDSFSLLVYGMKVWKYDITVSRLLSENFDYSISRYDIIPSVIFGKSHAASSPNVFTTRLASESCFVFTADSTSSRHHCCWTSPHHHHRLDKTTSYYGWDDTRSLHVASYWWFNSLVTGLNRVASDPGSWIVVSFPGAGVVSHWRGVVISGVFL